MILKKGVTIENKIKWDHKEWTYWYDCSIFIVYMITFSYIEDRDVHHYIIHTTIDEQIPFCEYFIVPYLLWFLFVAVTVFYFMFFNKNQWKEYYQLIITLGTGMTLFLIISLVFPNGQDLRPVLTGDSILSKQYRWSITRILRRMYFQVSMYLTLWHAALLFWRIRENIRKAPIQHVLS